MSGLKVKRFEVDGPLLITPPVYYDERGYFFELWRRDRYRDLGREVGRETGREVGREIGLDVDFLQANASRSRRGTLRGLHFQRAPHAQGKLVAVARGCVLDVAVDLREGSSTYGRHVKAQLDDETHAQLWVPRGFAHGFLAVSDTADVIYQVDAAHAPGAEGGVRWDDPDLGIDWELGQRLDGARPLTSARDAALPLLGEGFTPLAAG